MIPGHETVSVSTPLGIRFWDPARDVQIRDHIQVTARPSGAIGPKRWAFRTVTDVYAFDGLGGDASSSTWLIEVTDARERYLPVAFEVELPLPYRGVFLSGDGGSPPGSSPSGFHLYSAPTRPPAPELAVVRGELYDPIAEQPAGHALVRLDVAEQPPRHGIADAAGRFAITFPHPTFEDTLAASPGGEPSPLSERTWDLDLEVFYDPASQIALAGSTIPEYRSILDQPAASLWQTAGSPIEEGTVPRWTGALTYREELVVRTEDLSRLLVRPEDSSP